MKIIKRWSDYYFHRIKLKTKFFISHFIVMLIPTIVITALLYSQFSEVILSNTLQSEQLLIRQTAGNIEGTISQVHSASEAVANNSTFQKIFRFSPEKLNQTFTSDTHFSSELITFLNNTNTLINGITVSDIKIYLNEEYASLYEDSAFSSYDIFQPLEKVKGSYWYGIFQSVDKRTLICPSLYLTPSEAKNNGEFAIARKVDFYTGERFISTYVLVYFSKETIDSILRKDLSIDGSSIYLINQRDTFISSTNPQIAGKYILPYSKVKTTIPDVTKFSTVPYSSEKVYMSYREINETDWYMISVIPQSSILSSAKYLLARFSLTYLCFLVLAGILALLLSNSVVKRISTIITQMEHIRYGKLLKLEKTSSHDEIGDLTDTYNYVVDEMNSMLKTQAKSADTLRISELRALQAQINPHFLYNTLDMINWLSKDGKSDEVTAVVHALSKFYKLTLNKGNTIVSVELELEHVSLYIQLQNMRYQNKIHFLIDVPDELLEYEIPQLIFQPIVENSILHGILWKESKEGTIVITGWLDQKDIIFQISDDGIGISNKKIATILTGIGESLTGSNIGVSNTHRRLQLFYGQEFGLTYHSTPNIETLVEIRIPAKKVPITTQ